MFQVVLHEPEIPNNTGNIGRTCVATGCALHLIEPIGFDLSERACRRAGLDYWPRLNLRTHGSFESYADATPAADGRRWFFSGRTGRLAYDADFQPGEHLVFGKESVGLPDAVLQTAPDRVLRLPMARGERSLNVATVVCTAIYEGLRQCAARGDLSLDASLRFAANPQL
ncbi:MAG: tRNA (cytidine(34)-2'-O)-methyltransferase [Planctomycetota bacterium]